MNMSLMEINYRKCDSVNEVARTQSRVHYSLQCDNKNEVTRAHSGALYSLEQAAEAAGVLANLGSCDRKDDEHHQRLDLCENIGPAIQGEFKGGGDVFQAAIRMGCTDFLDRQRTGGSGPVMYPCWKFRRGKIIMFNVDDIGVIVNYAIHFTGLVVTDVVGTRPEVGYGEIVETQHGKVMCLRPVNGIGKSFKAFVQAVSLYLYFSDAGTDSAERRLKIVHPASDVDENSVESDVTKVTDAISHLLQHPRSEAAAKNVELAMLTAGTIMSDKFWQKLIAGVLLVLNITSDESLTRRIWQVITATFFEGNRLTTVSEMMAGFTQSSVSKSVRQCISTLLVPIIGDQKLTIGEIEVLSLNSAMKTDGMDLMKCITETVDYFVQASEYLAEHGSLLGFLVPTSEIRDFLDSYWKLTDYFEKFKYAQVDGSLEDLYESFTDLDEQGKLLKKSIADAQARRQLLGVCACIDAKLREVYAMMQDGDFRRLPFCMYMFGPTRCGKTTLSKIVLEHVAKALGTPIAKGTHATITGSSTFMTEIKPITKWISMDDVASVKPEFCTAPPAETFLRLMNNIITALNQASLPRKGEPGPKPEGLILTSNNYDMGACATQIDPRPILARFGIHCEIVVRKEWLDDQGLFDATKFFKEYEKGVISDAWLFSIREVEPEKGNIYVKDTFAKPVAVNHGVNFRMKYVMHETLGELKDIGIDTLLEYVKDYAIKNKQIQERIEESRDVSLFDEHFCPDCFKRSMLCKCVREPVVVAPADCFDVIGDSCAKVHESIEKKLADREWNKTEAYKKSAGRMIGIDTDPHLLLTRLKIVISRLMDAIAKTRILHYGTWLTDMPSEQLLKNLVATTNAREINTHAYKHAVKKLVRRLLMSGTLAMSPILGIGCAGCEPFAEDVEDYISKAISKVKRQNIVVDSRDVNYVDSVENNNFNTGEDRALTLAAMLSGTAIIAAKGPLLLEMCVRSATTLYNCFSPASCVLASGAAVYAGVMLYRDINTFRECKINSICREVRYARAFTEPFRNSLPILFASVGAGMSIASAWHYWSVETVTPAATVTRDAFFYEKWFQAHVPTFEVHQTGNEVCNGLLKNVVRVEYPVKEGVKRTCATAITTSRLLINQHFLPTEDCVMSIIRSPVTFDVSGNSVGVQNCVIKVDYELGMEQPIENSDLVILRLKERVQFKDILHNFSNNALHSGVGYFVTRDKTGKSRVYDASQFRAGSFQLSVKHRLTGKDIPVFDGIDFTGQCDFGDCGSPLVVGNKKASICGILVAKTDEGKGVIQLVSRKQVDKAMSELDGKFLVDLEPPDLGDMIKGDQSISKKHNIAHLPEGSDLRFEYHGRAGNFCPERDKIVRTPISDYLEEHGYECKWETPVPGANPNICSYDSSMKYIRTVLECTGSPHTKILLRAKDDYFGPIVDAVSLGVLKDKPLDWAEVANGIHGSNYIHAIDTSTSMGHPYGGKKNAYMSQDDKDQWWFDDYLMSEIKKFDGMLRKGKVPPVASTVTNKMEPRPQGKSARKIVSVNVVMTALFKKYFGPAFEHTISHTHLSETGVGINPYSRDWHRLWERMAPGIFDGVFATDFSCFDMRIASFVLEQVLVGNINIANAMKYTDADITAMHTLANWMLCAPTIIDGELLTLFNRMVSGIVGTSIFDGQVISLMQRACFFSLYPNSTNFRDNVKLITFGDDSFNTVKFAANRFNKKTFARYCNKLGMVVTSADKSDVNTRWDDPRKIEFLKRKFVWSYDHGGYVGPLDRDSILKPLHIGVMSSALTPEELLIDNCGRALVEASFHGKLFWTEMFALLSKAPGDPLSKSPFYGWTYRDFVDQWHCKYGIQSSNLVKTRLVEPASTVDKGVEIFEEDINDHQETLQAAVPQINAEVVTMVPAVISSRGKESTELGDFLSRPVEILTVPLSVTSTTFINLSPWTPYLADARVKEKLRGFRFLRANMVIDAYFNVSPRFYGKYMIGYYWETPGINFGFYGDSFQDNILASQAPCTYLSAEIDKASLTIPFMMQSEYMDIVFNNYVADKPGSGYADGLAGQIFLRSMTPLRYAGDPDIADSCDLVITARLENVELRGTTKVDPADVVDPVRKAENIATRVIAFATAAANVAKNMGALASALGFSRVSSEQEPGTMRVRAVGNMVSTDVPSIATKLTFHKDQGVYVGFDPAKRIGVNDPESLCAIACHNSYLTSFIWDQSASQGTLLFSTAVHPYMYDTDPNTGSTNFTSAGAIAHLFQHWSGSITFTFEVVASFLHRGRLLFVYDTRTTGDFDMHVNRCAILDITTNSSISLTVTPNGANTFCAVSDARMFAPSSVAAVSNNAYGVLSVYVLNNMSAPASTAGSPVDILVYTHMEDDAQFAFPSTRLSSTTLVNPASTTDCTTPKGTSVVLNNAYNTPADLYGMYYGEAIKSARGLMQRYTVNTSAIPITKTEHNVNYYIWMPPRGVYRGKSSTSGQNIAGALFVPDTISTVDFNIAYVTYIQWFSMMFVGYRGGIRWKFLYTGEGASDAISYGSASIAEDADPVYTRSDWSTRANMDLVTSSLAEQTPLGVQIEHPLQTPAIEVEVPFYTMNKFEYTRTAQLSSELLAAEANWLNMNGEKISLITMFTAAADDFSLLGYLGPVRVWIDQPTMVRDPA